MLNAAHEILSSAAQVLMTPRVQPTGTPPAAAPRAGTDRDSPTGIPKDSVLISPEARAAAEQASVRPAEAPALASPPSATEGSEATQTARAGHAGTAGGTELSKEEQQQVDELKSRDREVRQHEQAHKAAAGRYGGAISYSYTTGPDGKRYASGGSVPIDTSPVAGDPEATIQKMRQVQAAANAPAQPSSADRNVAAAAARELQKAQAEARAEAGAADDPQPTPANPSARAANAYGFPTATDEHPRAHDPAGSGSSSGSIIDTVA